MSTIPISAIAAIDWPRLTDEQKHDAWARLRAGESTAEYEYAAGDYDVIASDLRAEIGT